jgi:3D (Asp-Asp-Asp) domain-containing protein
MERTMMARHNIHYGDTVLVKGTGVYDGEWIVEDTMHPRYAGQDKIDFLVPTEVRTGKWERVEIYKRK